MDTYGPPCPFRACGMTWAAGLFHKSDAALALHAELNGCRVDQIPRGARSHSNAYMQDWMEALARRRMAGDPYRNGKRLLLPSEIAT